MVCQGELSWWVKLNNNNTPEDMFSHIKICVDSQFIYRVSIFWINDHLCRSALVCLGF